MKQPAAKFHFRLNGNVELLCSYVKYPPQKGPSSAGMSRCEEPVEVAYGMKMSYMHKFGTLFLR